MWPWELMQEFVHWIWSSEMLSYSQKKSQFYKFKYNGFMTLVSMILIFIFNGAYSDTIALIHTSLMVVLIIDFVLYVIRWFALSNRHKVFNIVVFAHLFVHYALIVNTSFAVKYFLFYSDSEAKEQSQIANFIFIYIFVILRVIYYVWLTVVIIPFVPWLLYGIIKKRRNRLRLYEFIRDERRRSIGSFAYLNQQQPVRNVLPAQNLYNENNNEAFPEAQYLLDDNNNDFNDFDFQNNSFDELLLQLLRGHQFAPRPAGNFDNLRRITYEEASKKLDYDECSIWMDLFKNDMNEELIYLPWDTKHIFHSSWILEWLKRDPNWPLWKSAINDEAIRLYKQY